MATATIWIERQNNPMVISGTATIDINETATLTVPCHGRAKVFLGIPSAFTGTTLTFTVQPFPPADPASPTAAPPFRQLRDESGNVVTATVAADRVLEIGELGGCYAFTIVSGSSEAAARAIEVACVGPYPASGGTNNLTIEGGSITAHQGTKTASLANAWPVSETSAAGASRAYVNTNQPVITAKTSAGAEPGSSQTVAATVGWSVVSNPGSGAESAASQAVSTAAEDNIQVKASAGNLFGFTVASSTAQFIQIHNVASAPGGGAVPFAGQSYPIAAGGVLTVSYFPPLRCTTGIFIANSTAQLSYTDGGDDCLFGVQYG